MCVPSVVIGGLNEILYAQVVTRVSPQDAPLHLEIS